MRSGPLQPSTGSSANFRGRQAGGSAVVGPYLRPDDGLEQRQHLPGLGMTARGLLGEDQLPGHGHVEYAPWARFECESVYPVLVGPQDLLGHAHGAGQVVSGEAVDDLDAVALLLAHAEATRRETIHPGRELGVSAPFSLQGTLDRFGGKG